MPDVLETIKDAYVLDHVAAFEELELLLLGPRLNDDELQKEIYEIGKEHFEVLREWFAVCYWVLLGTDSGPRLGQLINLLGADSVAQQLSDRLDRVVGLGHYP